jgi:hypothetical protein
LIAEEKLQLGLKKNKKKLQQLLEINHQYIQCNGCLLDHNELLTYQGRSKTPLALSDLTFNDIPLASVFDELLHLGRHQLGIDLRPCESRAAQTDFRTLADPTVRSCAVNLVGKSTSDSYSAEEDSQSLDP